VEEQQKARKAKKKKVREEWQANLRLAKEERKRQVKIQFDKIFAKTLSLEGEGETVATKKTIRKDLTSEELDQEFRELNARLVKANARLAVEKLLEQRGADRKEKSAASGRRMMRAEEETGNDSRLPPV